MDARCPPLVDTLEIITSLTSEANASSSSTAVGVSLAGNVDLDSAEATLGRSVTAGGAVTVQSVLDSTLSVEAEAMAKGAKAPGEDGSGEEGDKSANDSLNSQLGEGDRKAGTFNKDKDDVYETASDETDLDKQAKKANDKAGENSTEVAGSQGGGDQKGSSTGVAASIGVNVAVTDNTAAIGDGIVIVAGGEVRVSAVGDTDATAVTKGNALVTDTAVGAAISANIAVVSNTATIGGTITANGITVEAVNAGDGTKIDANTFSAQAYSLGVGKDTGGAGSAGLNVLVMGTEAVVNSGAVLTSHDDVEVLAGNKVDLMTAAGAILDMGPRVVIIKKGEHGSLMCNADGDCFILPAFPTSVVIDPTGAGDSFAGAMMGHLAQSKKVDVVSLREAIAYGTVMASFAIGDFSIHGVKTIDINDIENRLDALRKMTQF